MWQFRDNFQKLRIAALKWYIDLHAQFLTPLVQCALKPQQILFWERQGSVFVKHDQQEPKPGINNILRQTSLNVNS